MKEGKEKNKFFKAQDAIREKNERVREDKHLLPIDKFADPDQPPKNGKTTHVVDSFSKLPFGTIDLIFNHKNVWANLQNPNPSKIYFHIHDPLQWLPLISEPDIATDHPKYPKDENNKDMNEDDDDEILKKRVNKKNLETKDTKMLKVKDTGDFMKPI